MPKVIDDGFAEELRRQYYQLRDRVDRLDRDMATRQKFAPREDFVMLQASTTGAIPAVTASTAGITPGKTTTAKMLTINSSDAAVRNTSDRSVTVYNLGKGQIGSGQPFPAHRDFLTGKFVAWGDSTGATASGGLPELTIYSLSRGSTPVDTPLTIDDLSSPSNTWISATSTAPTAMISNSTIAHLFMAHINVQWDVSVPSTNKFANGYIQADIPAYGSTYGTTVFSLMPIGRYYFYAIGTTGSITRSQTLTMVGRIRLPSGSAFELQPKDFGTGTNYGTMQYAGFVSLLAVESTS